MQTSDAWHREPERLVFFYLTLLRGQSMRRAKYCFKKNWRLLQQCYPQTQTIHDGPCTSMVHAWALYERGTICLLRGLRMYYIGTWHPSGNRNVLSLSLVYHLLHTTHHVSHTLYRLLHTILGSLCLCRFLAPWTRCEPVYHLLKSLQGDVKNQSTSAPFKTWTIGDHKGYSGPSQTIGA